MKPGGETELEWRLPEFAGQPIAEIGLAISGTGKRADGTLLVDYLRWDGAPQPHAAQARAGMRFLANGLGEWRQHLVKALSAELPHLAGRAAKASSRTARASGPTTR